jgi:subfamily B ATP-binding cassette protein MsbA
MSEIKDKKTSFFRIFKFVNGFWKLLGLSFVLNIVFSTFETISIALIKPIFQIIFEKKMPETPINAGGDFFKGLKDSFYNTVQNLIYNPHDLVATLVNLSILIIGIFLMKNIFKYMSQIVGAKVQEGIIKNMRDQIFTKLTSLSIDFFSKSRQGFLLSAITNDVATVNSATINAFTVMLKEITQIILFLIMLLTLSPYLTLISFSTSLVSIVVVRGAIKYLRKYAKRMQNAMADYTGVMQETIFGIRAVKGYNAEDTVNGKFTSQTAKYVRSAIKHKKVVALIPSFNELFAICALCIVLFVGGSQALSGELKPDELMTFLFSLFSIMSPISSFVNQISLFQSGLVASERVFSIIDAKSSVEDGDRFIEGFQNSIEVKNISFAYEENEVLKDCSIKIEKGKKIALVGGSGSGKSTMLDLIIRFYDPKKGEICLDGRNIKELNTKSYRSLFGIVSQETLLFNDSVENNIKYGFEASEEAVIKAAKTANAYKFIENMPNGLKTMIGDRGVLISGGERQRIAIARALIREPKILVFDEATSALDAESEKIVQEAINGSLENRTAIIVAHRLATIIDCDEIIVFDRGRIIERGSHSELIEKNGVYRKLCEIQFGGSGIE